MTLPVTSWTDETMPTSSWTDEDLPTLGDKFVIPGFVEDDFVFEDAYEPETLPTTSWTDE